jgi:hypothetical protein
LGRLAGKQVIGVPVAGLVVLDFGAFPGSAMGSVAVIGQPGILATSKVDAWISLDSATTEHSKDEHLIENLIIRAGNIVPGVGFTVYGQANNPQNNGNAGNRIYGKWSCNWEWV